MPTDPAAAVDYPSLYEWSIAHPDKFWPAVWKFCDVVAETMPDGAQWREVVRGLGPEFRRLADEPPEPEWN